MPQEATTLHADADAFFAAVEQRDDPGLRGRPVIVGPGVVMAASYEAKAYGIRSGMGGAQARRLCPQAIAVPPRFDAYVDASRSLFAVFRDTSPVVEGLSMEEAFLDVGGLDHVSGPPSEIAVRLRRRVREEVGLAISVGVATTKVVAKMASAAAKPDGLLVVPARREREFLAPLPVERIWGVGPAIAGWLREHGVETVGQIAALTETELISIAGHAAGRRLHAIAHHREWRPVRGGRRRRSYGAQRAMGLGRFRRDELEPTLAALVDRVTRRMRHSGRVGRTVVLRLRFGDYARASRSRTLRRATAESRTILVAARGLLQACAPTIECRGLTMLGITVSNVEMSGAGVQLTLPLDRHTQALDRALDEVRERFGADAVTRADVLGRFRELSPALLADER